MNGNKWKDSSLTFYFLLAVSLFFYLQLGYFTHRNDSHWVVLYFTILFGTYFYLLVHFSSNEKLFPVLIGVSILFRFVLLFQTPNLSDDYYRFIFDGNLSAHGFNPYEILPSNFIQSKEAINLPIQSGLYSKLNSPHYYTVYPAVLQYIFGISAYLANGNEWLTILYMRISIVLAELGTMIIVMRLLKHWSIPKEKSLWYYLNPLVIIELTGNLHFEAVMLFFLVLSLYLLQKEKLIYSGIAFALSIASKLIPILFIPLLFRYIGQKKFIWFSITITATLTVLFLPFISLNLLQHIFSSIGLYFHTFEVNASIFYLLKVGLHSLTGLDSKNYLRIFLPIISTGLLLFIALKNNSITISQLPAFMLISLLLYYFFSTTVHPWYTTVLVLLSVFTNSYAAIIWSGMITLSYVTYHNGSFHENLYFISIEYLTVGAYLYGEYKNNRIAIGFENTSTQLSNELI